MKRYAGWNNCKPHVSLTGVDYTRDVYKTYLAGKKEAINMFDKMIYRHPPYAPKIGMVRLPLAKCNYFAPNSQAVHVPCVYVMKCRACEFGPYVGVTRRSIKKRCMDGHGRHKKKWPTHRLDVWPVHFLKDDATVKEAEVWEVMYMTLYGSIKSPLNPTGANCSITGAQVDLHRLLCGLNIYHSVSSVPLDETYNDNPERFRGRIDYYFPKRPRGDAEDEDLD